MSQWFEIRNGPKPSGTVVAIWHGTNDDYELAVGVKNLEYPPEDVDNKRTYGANDVQVISETLIHEISEADFSVCSEIADIPQIISDGMLHYLGVLEWNHVWHEMGGTSTTPKVHDRIIPCKGEVYVKVVWKAEEWYNHSYGVSPVQNTP